MTRKSAFVSEPTGDEGNDPAGGKIISITSAFVCFLHSLGLASKAQASGEIQREILRVTDEISVDSSNAQLYLKRAELYRLDRNWQAALRDYDHAEQLDTQLTSVALARGRMMLDAGWLDEARSVLDDYILRYPNHGDAFLTRARVLRHLGLHLQAAADQTRALQLLPEVKPEHYIDRAQILLEAGEEFLREALAAIEEGISQLGPTETLVQQAVDLELQTGLFDSALQRLIFQTEHSPEPEKWLFRQGEALIKAGMLAEARERFSQALSGLEKLPKSQRNARSNLVLESRIRLALGKLIEELSPENTNASF